MPISSPASYVSTTDAFRNHWKKVDKELGKGNEIRFPWGGCLAVLKEKREALVATQADVQACIDAVDALRKLLDQTKRTLIESMSRFNEKIRALFAGSKWERSLAKVPTFSESQGPIFDALDETAALWRRVNAASEIENPLTLLGGSSQSEFVVQIASLRSTYTNLAYAQVDLRIAREERTDIEDAIYVILKAYRQILPSYLEKGHPLLESMPILTPQPSAKPKMVKVRAKWFARKKKVRITWTPGDEADLQKYHLRFSAGPEYSVEDEETIAVVEPDQPREVFTDSGLAAPGNIAGFKVYVITTTGNEKGSNTVTVTRPVTP